MAKVVVFAGTSFIGQHLCEHLTHCGHRVSATTRKPDAGSQLAACDITQRATVEAVLRDSRPDWIIQCAAATSSRNAGELYPVHVFGTLNVLEAAAEFVPGAAICVMGSAAEYGPVSPDHFPVDESCVCRPPTFFGASKLAQTQLAIAAAATHQQRISVVRPFNVIGPGLPDFYFAASLAARLTKMQTNEASSGSTFEVFNAQATRDFVDVRDVASAITLLLEKATPESGTCDIFNIATETETPLLDIASYFGKLAGGFVPQPAGELDSRGGIIRSCGSAAKLASATGWKPEIAWQQSVTDLWQSLTSE